MFAIPLQGPSGLLLDRTIVGILMWGTYIDKDLSSVA